MDNAPFRINSDRQPLADWGMKARISEREIDKSCPPKLIKHVAISLAYRRFSRAVPKGGEFACMVRSAMHAAEGFMWQVAFS
jgi:hypothetical protein